MIQKIYVTHIDGTKSKVWAVVQDGIAVHPACHAVDNLLNPYAVTHVQSGGLIKCCNGKSRALEFAAKCVATQIHGVSLGSMSGCEVCANALLIAPLLGARTDDPTGILNTAAHAADVLACAKEKVTP